MKKTYSRLARKEYKESVRKTVMFGLLTVLLILVILFLGIPVLIKMAVFLGNIKSSYTPVQNENQLPPVPPRFNPTYEATNSAQMTLEGFSDPEVFIEYFQNETVKTKVLANTDGSFLIPDITLLVGKNEIYAVATNKDDVKSQPSEKLIIDFDNTPPVINITDPPINSSLFKPDGKVQIKGDVSEEVDLTINDRLIIMDSSNRFVFPVTLSDDENKFKAVAIDKAGNKTEIKFTLTRE